MIFVNVFFVLVIALSQVTMIVGPPIPSPTRKPSRTPSDKPSRSPSDKPSRSPSDKPSTRPKAAKSAKSAKGTMMEKASPMFSAILKPIGTRRALSTTNDMEMNQDIEPQRAMEIIESLGGNPDATFLVLHGLISKESCESLIKFVESSFALDGGRQLPVGSYFDVPDGASWHTDEHRNTYNKKISAAELVQLIGRTETLKLANFFRESRSQVQNIDSMYLVRQGSPDEFEGTTYYDQWHIQSYTSVDVVLNDDFKGGEILHLNRNGVQKLESYPGTAISYGSDNVHGTLPQTSGKRYMLILNQHFPTLLSPEIVDVLASAAA